MLGPAGWVRYLCESVFMENSDWFLGFTSFFPIKSNNYCKKKKKKKVYMQLQ